VSLHYGYTPVDAGGWLLTFAGIGLAVVVRRHPVVTDDDGDRPEAAGPPAPDADASVGEQPSRVTTATTTAASPGP
jgi:hypothetical protein